MHAPENVHVRNFFHTVYANAHYNSVRVRVLVLVNLHCLHIPCIIGPFMFATEPQVRYLAMKMASHVHVRIVRGKTSHERLLPSIPVCVIMSAMLVLTVLTPTSAKDNEH